MNGKGMLFLLLLTFFPLTAMAQSDATKEALARAQFLLRQLNAEKTQLAKQLAVVQGEKQALENKASVLEKDLDRTEQSKALTEERMQDTLDQWKSAYQELREQNQALQLELRQALTEKRGVETELTDTNQKLDICVRANDRLAELGFGILDEFEKQGMNKGDPFTGIKRVEIQNIVQDYRFGMEDQQLNFSLQDGAPPSLN